jgi:hypothetical protein
MTNQLSKADAIALTQKAHLHFDVFYSTLLQLYRGNGHILMGYQNWPEFMKAEFDVNRSEAYKKLQQATVKERLPEGDEPQTKHLRQLVSFPDEYQVSIWRLSKSYAAREQIELTGSVVKACGERFVELVTTGGTSVNGESLAMDAALTEELYEGHQRQKSHMKEREYIFKSWSISFGMLKALFSPGMHEFEFPPLDDFVHIKVTAWIDDEAKS